MKTTSKLAKLSQAVSGAMIVAGIVLFGAAFQLEKMDVSSSAAWALVFAGSISIAAGMLRLAFVVWTNMFVEAILEAEKGRNTATK